MYKVFGFWMGPKSGVQPAADKNLYLLLTVEKILAFAVFNKKYLLFYDCVATNFTAVVNCAYPKTEIHSGTTEIHNP